MMLLKKQPLQRLVISDGAADILDCIKQEKLTYCIKSGTLQYRES